MDLKTAYSILELEPSAAPRDLKRAYRSLVRAWHPDLHDGRPQLKRHCEERMRRINEAYDYLKELGPLPPSFTPSAAAAPPSPAEPPSRGPEAPAEEPAVREWARKDFPLDPRRWVKARRAPASLKLPALSALDCLGLAFLASLSAAVFYFFLRDPLPGYLDVLRLTLSASALYGAYASLERRLWDFVFVLCCLALVLNPVTPLPFTRLEWTVLNLMTPSFFFYVWVTLLQRDSQQIN